MVYPLIFTGLKKIKIACRYAVQPGDGFALSQ
jgi:hypothetical protein